MYPVNFCFVFPVKFILLQLCGTEEYDVPGRDDGFIFRFVKMKMHQSGNDVNDLEVFSSLGAVGWHFWMAGEPVGATASDDQGTGPVFKIQMENEL